MSAVLPLLPHLRPGTRFAELCAGDGRLIRHLEAHGHKCVYASDIEPQTHGTIFKQDAMEFADPTGIDAFITNPPWDRKIMHPMIAHMARMRPTWLLFDADWMHTKQSREFMPWCEKIVSVGRVKWIEDSASVGKDNAAWYRFDATNDAMTKFVGRAA